MKPVSNKKLRVGVIDLVHKGPSKDLYARVMNANLASIMPQVVATWCEQEGHDVQYICYTGLENIVKEVPDDTDLVFICAFTQSAFGLCIKQHVSFPGRCDSPWRSTCKVLP